MVAVTGSIRWALIVHRAEVAEGTVALRDPHSDARGLG